MRRLFFQTPPLYEKLGGLSERSGGARKKHLRENRLIPALSCPSEVIVFRSKFGRP
jgi:hypothetical protein